MPRGKPRGTYHVAVEAGSRAAGLRAALSDELEHLVGRLRDMGVSVTVIRDQPGARYVMAEGPDGLLIELFQPDLDELASELRDHFHLSP